MKKVNLYTVSKNNLYGHRKGSAIGTTEFIMVMAWDYDSVVSKLELIRAYDEAKERELFETAYPLDKGVTWVKDIGKTGSYAVRVNSYGGFWACTNAAYQLQIKWEVWSKCAKSRARSA